MPKKLLIIMPAVVVLILAGTWFYVNYRARTLVDIGIADFLESGDYRDLDYDSIFVNWNGDITLENIHVIDIAGNEFIVKDVDITNVDYLNEVPYHFNVSARGLSFPAGIPQFGNSANRSLNSYLESIMDNDFIPVEMNYRYEYLPEDNSRLDSEFSFNLPDSFHLSSVSTMKNFPLEALDENTAGPSIDPSRLAPLMRNANIPEASMALKDLGLVNAMMVIQGEETGVGSEEFRRQLIAQVQTLYLLAPQSLQAIARDTAEKVSRFLEGGKTLRISIEPEYEGSISRLQSEVMSSVFIGDFDRIIELLNLEIEIGDGPLFSKK